MKIKNVAITFRRKINWLKIRFALGPFVKSFRFGPLVIEIY